VLSLCYAKSSEAQTLQYVYSAVTHNITTVSTSCGDFQSSCNIVGVGAQYHQLSWNVLGTLSACSVRVDSSADGVTWNTGDIVAAQTCTSNGNAISTAHTVNYTRINVTSITPVSTATLTVNLTGYANNPVPSGGTVTGVTASSPVTSSGGATPNIACPTCTTESGSPVAGNIPKFSTATNLVPAAASDLIALWASCSGVQYLGADGNCHSVAGTPTWDAIQNAAGNLTLANGTNTTTFNQTNNTVWSWANTTVATNATTNASPTFNSLANFWNGSASATDTWTQGSFIQAGTNAASVYEFNHTGTSGTAAVRVPNLIVSTGSTVSPIAVDVRATTGTGFPQIGTSDGTAYTTFFTSSANDNAIYWNVANDLRFGTANNTPLYTTAGFIERFRMTKAGQWQATTYATKTACAANGTAASPSVVSCSAAPAGAFSCATNASAATCTINTTAVTANSIIIVQEVADEGTPLGVTCNTTPTVTPAILLATHTAATGFTINMPTITTNPACFNYWVIN
jgi:GH24 family phage-related lysozyme (muramidase)